MKTSMMVLALALGSLALTGCASKQDEQHSEARTDGTRVFYNCSSLIQKQLVIQQFNQCYLNGPKTKENRFDCEEVARSMACDRMVEITRSEPAPVQAPAPVVVSPVVISPPASVVQVNPVPTPAPVATVQ
jgi:hypothetical protein